MSEDFGLLYAVPSFWEGVARAFDMGGTLTVYNTSENGRLADERALRSDWRAVGDDMRAAVAQYRREHPNAKSKK